MAQFLAIEIENDQVLVAYAKSTGRRPQISKAFSIEIDLQDDDTSIGQKLKRGLSDHGIGRGDAIAIVSRTSSEMRELVVPPAPDDELPDLVRFKAKSDFGSLNDQWTLDFVPFATEANQPINVLAVAISPELKKQLTTICETAGLRLKHIVFRPLATIDLVRSRLADRKLRLLVDHTVDQTDLTVTSGTDLMATRTVRIPKSHSNDEQAKQLTGEIRRTIASTSRRLGGKQIDEILICGSSASGIYESIGKELEVPLDFADPFTIADVEPAVKKDMPANTGQFAAPFGCLIQQFSEEKHRLDFLNPRMKVDKKVDRKKIFLFAGLAAAALLIGCGFCWWLLQTQATEIENLKADLTELKDKNEGKALGSRNVDQVIGEVATIDEWVTNRFDWLEHLHLISSDFESPDDAIVDNLSGRIRRGQPMITIIGRAKSVDSETKLMRNLAEHYGDVEPQRSGPSGDATYPSNYEYVVNLTPDSTERINEIDMLARELKQKQAAELKEKLEKANSE